MQIETASVVLGADHVGFSVSKLEETKTFFVEALGFSVFNEDKEYPAYFLKNGHVIVTLWQVTDPDSSTSFSRKNNVGLHHFALAVESYEKLDELYVVVKNYPGVEIEFSPELLGKGPSKHMIFREPSGVRLELIHRGSL